MGVLSNYEPVNVFQYFEKICSIPHGSTNVGQISNYLVEFAKERGLKYRQDEKLNVIIWKDGSEGYEQSEPVILQGHMDMVAVKVDGCDKNMETDGLDLEVLDGDLISAKGTSLGGDNGIAVAIMLAVLDDDSIAHPPLEAVFTVDEEIGMLGADYIDVSDLKGRLFMNMDSEDEGVFTVSCAGGATATCILPYDTETMTADVLKVRLDGFIGGHSGVEINKGRLNANVTLGRILYGAEYEDFRLISVNGGEKDNAIATYSEAVIAVPKDQIEQTKETMQAVMAEVQAEYSAVDPDIKISFEEQGEQEVTCMTALATASVITCLVNLPNGIQRMNPEMEGMVQTSLNLGILSTSDADVRFSYAVRSSSETEKEFLIDKLHSLTEFLGGSVEISGAYPGWEYKSDSRLRDVMVETYKSLYGKEPVVEGIHAGLECGMFSAKMEGLDAVSFGPQMANVHTTNEVLSISSTKRTWDLVLKVFEKLK